jgi:hypothetical protein
MKRLVRRQKMKKLMRNEVDENEIDEETTETATNEENVDISPDVGTDETNSQDLDGLLLGMSIEQDPEIAVRNERTRNENLNCVSVRSPQTS